MEHNMIAWEKRVSEYQAFLVSLESKHRTQGQAGTAITVYLSSCEQHDHSWIPTIEEWREMLEKTKLLITTAGFIFELKACTQALGGWFWRYHWRELDRELFKQYAIAMASHFGGDISAVMNGVWDDVIEDTESGDPVFKSTAPLLRHLMNVSEIPGCVIHPSR